MADETTPKEKKPEKPHRTAETADYVAAAVALHDYAAAQLREAGAARSVLLSLGRRIDKIEKMPVKGVPVEGK